MMTSPNYSRAYVIGLFNDMAKTYGAVNLISSFGFSHFWRKKCVASLGLESGHACADLMCGMGEATSLMLKVAGRSLQVDAVDFCPEMTQRCQVTMRRQGANQVVVQTSDVFELAGEPVYDRIACSFGLKTFNNEQLQRFALLVSKLLRPRGKAAFVEIHVPSNRLLRVFYLFYVRYVIPAIGSLCLGNPDCYKHLAVFTEDFARRDIFATYLKEVGLETTERPLFFGCARLYLAKVRDQLAIPLTPPA